MEAFETDESSPAVHAIHHWFLRIFNYTVLGVVIDLPIFFLEDPHSVAVWKMLAYHGVYLMGMAAILAVVGEGAKISVYRGK